MACVISRGQNVCYLRGQTSVNSVTALLKHKKYIKKHFKEKLNFIHLMKKTLDALMFSIGIDSVLNGQRARKKVFYQQSNLVRHITYEWSVSEQVSFTTLSNFCQYLTGTTSTDSFSSEKKIREHLTTSFYQQGKTVLTAMDLPLQALEVEAKRVNMRNCSVILSAFVCCSTYKV